MFRLCEITQWLRECVKPEQQTCLYTQCDASSFSLWADIKSLLQMMLVLDFRRLDVALNRTDGSWRHNPPIRLCSGTSSISVYKTPFLFFSPAVSSVVTLTRRRAALPSPCPSSSVSLWNILRNNIGKDLSKVAMPVQLNEPLNTLQRLCEELEYSDLLDTANQTPDPYQRMVSCNMTSSKMCISKINTMD